MSKTIDERVVEMRFDNKQFESNIQTTMSTLDKFKQKLNLTGASKGLEDINTAAKNVNMSGLGTAVETVHAKFSALEVMGITALVNITNSAVNAGKKISSALTIDPIKTGFQEYETQINAVQTILANTESKGTTLQQVNRALDELNTYADKTIYNFTEMTKNIGTFTAAGIDLDTSVSAIQGIANLAAVSGSTSQQASTAMYQLSQALASGTVKLMDWNSVVNAGMGGQVFQDALKQTARVHGIAIDKMIKDEGSFRETLQKGWLTSDILTETLNQFTMAAEEGSEEWEAYKKSLMDTGYTEKQAVSILKMANTATDAATKVKTFTQLWDTLKEAAQSGWTQSWEIMIGDFEEAKGLLTDISDRIGAMIGESAEARNELLSGGLSSGWKQFLNQGIADEAGYKDTLKKVAKEHGVSIDKMINHEKKLDDSLTDTEAFQKALTTGLKDGSLTSDMFSESVYKLANKMTNMSTEELKAAGYTVEHVKQIKELSAGLKDGSVSMDEFVKKMMRPSGRENIIQALWNSFDALMDIIAPIKEAFREIFPRMTGEQLYNITEKIRDLTEKFKISEETASKIKRTFKGVFSVISIGVEAFKALAKGAITIISNFTGIGGGVLSATASIGDFLSGVRDSIKETDLFSKSVEKVTDFITKAIDKIKEVTGFLKEKIAVPGFEGFLDIMKSIWNIITKIGEKISKVGASIGDALTNAFRSGDISSGLDVINGGIFTAILLGIKKFINGFSDAFDEVGGTLDSIKGILNGVKDSLEAYQQDLKANILLKIAGAIGILALSILVLSTIDPGKITSSLGAITVLFGDLMGAMFLFNKIGGEYRKSIKAVTTMIGVSTAILILASALKKISELNFKELTVGLTGVLGLTAIVVAAAKIMSSGSKKVIKGATQMVIMAAALKILVYVCEDLSKFSWKQLGKGLAGIGGILLEFVAFQALMKLINPKKMLSSATSLVLIGAALEIFSDVCKKMGGIKWESFGKAGAAIGGILLLASGFALLSGLSKKMVMSSAALVIIGSAMEIFANVCNKFGQLKWESLGKAGAAIGGILLLASGFALLAGLSKGMLTSVVSLTIMAAALEIFADICNKFGQLKWESLGKAGAAIGGILVLATGFALLAGLATGILKSASALLIMATSLAILTPVLKTLGSMSWESIGKGLVTIGGAFAVIGLAAAILQPLVPTILALAGSVALFGVACLAMGTGVSLLAAGLTALSVAGTAGATAIVAALTIIITGIAGLIPEIAKRLGEAIIIICDVLVECVPTIAEAVLKLIAGVLSALVTYAPQIVDSLFQFIIKILEGVAKHLPALIQVAVDVIMSFFSGIVSALGSIDTDTLLKGVAGIGLLTIIMTALSAFTALIPGAIVGVLGMGAVIAELALVFAAIGALAQIPGLEWLIGEGGQLLKNIGNAIGGFVGGIVGGLMEGVTSSLPQIATDLSTFMTNLQPFIYGAKTINPSVLENVKSLAQVILILTGANLLESLTSWFTGGSSLSSFGAELAKFGPYMAQYAASVSGIDVASVQASANAAKALAQMTSYIPNEGGIVSWFAGENSISKFASELPILGKGLSGFSKSVSGINPESITAASTAAKNLAQMTSYIPNEGGIASWFAGENSISKFGDELISLGEGLKGFSEKITGINPENITSAASAAKALAQMASYIPNEGGLVAWFTGDNSVANFADDLPILGEGLKGFSDSVDGIVPENITAAASAAKSLAQMADTTPKNTDKIIDFGDNLKKFGKSLSSYFKNTSGITDSSAKATITAVNAIKKFTSIDSGKAKSAVKATNDIIKVIKGMSAIKGESTAGFSKALGNIGNSGVNSFLKAVNGASSKMTKAGQSMINKFVEGANKQNSKMEQAGKTAVSKFAEGIKSKLSTAEKACKTMVSDCSAAIKDKYDSFYNAGSYLVDGFADGISENDYKATAKAKAMAKAAYKAAKKELKVNSPSKVFRKLGYSVPEGFAMGIDRLSSMSNRSAVSMADNAIKNVSNSISRIAEAVNSDIDSQPTIRPVLDLSDVSSGAGTINGMFGNGISIGVSSNLSAINSAMNRRQNRSFNSDLLSAVNGLRDDFASSDNGVNVEVNLNYDASSDANQIANEIAIELRRAIRRGV